jgi:hypothetical protein
MYDNWIFKKDIDISIHTGNKPTVFQKSYSLKQRTLTGVLFCLYKEGVI